MNSRTLLSTCVVWWLLCAPNALSAPIIFTDEAAFLGALSDFTTIDFEEFGPGADHIPLTGDEYAALGLTFSSPLADPLGKLFVESGFYHTSNLLSIDEEPFTCCDGWNDSIDFHISVAAHAFGVRMVDLGGAGSGESITVHDGAGEIYFQGSIPSYFGILSDTALTEVYIQEAGEDGDDVGYDDIVLGNISVPEPASLLLLASGLFGLGMGRRRARP